MKLAMSVWCIAVAAVCSPIEATAQARAEGAESTSPNILWIIAEDMSPDLGVYGTLEVETPNLDRLARRGMRFTHAFSTAPLCTPSRSALATGVYQTSIGAHHQRLPDSLKQPLPEGVQPITDRLREAGYFTANIRSLTDRVRGTGKTDWGFQYEGEPFDTDRWRDLRSHQPFYAQVNFQESHRPFGHEGPADPAKVTFPPYYPDHAVTRADWAGYLDEISGLDRKVGVVLDMLEAAGLAENTVVLFFSDHGRPMPRGKQWCYDSGLRVPLIVYWPESISAPAQYDAGSVSDQLVSLLDMTATTLAIAGAEEPQRMQGRVLFGPEADPPRRYVFGAVDRDGEVRLRSRTVRTERYRYIRNDFRHRPLIAATAYRKAVQPLYHLMTKLAVEDRLLPIQRSLVEPRPAEELYDLKADPYEMHNLARSPKHQDVLSRLRNELDRWIERTGDQGQKPDPPSVVQYFKAYGERSARQRADRIKRMKHRVYQADNEYLELVYRVQELF